VSTSFKVQADEFFLDYRRSKVQNTKTRKQSLEMVSHSMEDAEWFREHWTSKGE
jgi:hypothetical protein